METWDNANREGIGQSFNNWPVNIRPQIYTMTLRFKDVCEEEDTSQFHN